MKQEELPLFPDQKPVQKKFGRSYKPKGSVHPKTVFDGIPCRCYECKAYEENVQNMQSDKTGA